MYSGNRNTFSKISWKVFFVSAVRVCIAGEFYSYKSFKKVFSQPFVYSAVCVCVHVCDSFLENFKIRVPNFSKDNYGKLYFHRSISISSKYLYRAT